MKSSALFALAVIIASPLALGHDVTPPAARAFKPGSRVSVSYRHVTKNHSKMVHAIVLQSNSTHISLISMTDVPHLVALDGTLYPGIAMPTSSKEPAEFEIQQIVLWPKEQ